MAPFRLRIPRPAYEEMLDHARADRPLECCGLLAGRVVDGVGEVRAAHRLANELRSPTEFLSEPRSLFAALKAMRADGTEALAVYHSHPSSPPVPSRKDCERNWSEGTVTVIVGFAGSEPDVRAWWLSADGYRDAEWSVE